MAAFSDSVDSTGTYSTGICGEKLVALTSPPAFVSITLGANKITDPFTINYDGSHASESDVFVSYSVQYSVSFKEYGVAIAALQSSFTF